MLDFPTRQIRAIKNLLLKQQKEVEQNIEEIEKDDPAKDKVLAESSEPGTDSYIADIHTKSLVILDSLKRISLSIRSALLKIRKGTYGKCERCSKQIEALRLWAMPTARYCLSCSKIKEKLSN
ncbi:MAG: TraR/DksA C4-type zinc finger protein [Candidatus Daviesbacteria bacterium]|nr:TraR/DksA C4-type zinc finger protein [Candidatus Daviesbacteria bacterium]